MPKGPAHHLRKIVRFRVDVKSNRLKLYAQSDLKGRRDVYVRAFTLTAQTILSTILFTHMIKLTKRDDSQSYWCVRNCFKLETASRCRFLLLSLSSLQNIRYSHLPIFTYARAFEIHRHQPSGATPFLQRVHWANKHHLRSSDFHTHDAPIHSYH